MVSPVAYRCNADFEIPVAFDKLPYEIPFFLQACLIRVPIVISLHHTKLFILLFVSVIRILGSSEQIVDRTIKQISHKNQNRSGNISAGNPSVVASSFFVV